MEVSCNNKRRERPLQLFCFSLNASFEAYYTSLWKAKQQNIMIARLHIFPVCHCHLPECILDAMQEERSINYIRRCTSSRGPLRGEQQISQRTMVYNSFMPLPSIWTPNKFLCHYMISILYKTQLTWCVWTLSNLFLFRMKSSNRLVQCCQLFPSTADISSCLSPDRVAPSILSI